MNVSATGHTYTPTIAQAHATTETRETQSAQLPKSGPPSAGATPPPSGPRAGIVDKFA